MFGRAILLILDGVGVGALPDAADYNDKGTATLQHAAAHVGGLRLPCLEQLGLGCIAPAMGFRPVAEPQACWGKMVERSAGKDSVTGHWEIAGIVQEQPFATFPHGFPPEIIEAFAAETGMRPLGNIAASGTEIIRQLGEEHLRSGQPIVYTSSDSVFQIAAHEDVIPPEQLYRICRQAEQILQPYNLCRVIARPFRGTRADNFARTSGRHDFPLRPPEPMLLSILQHAGIATCGIGKIGDLYAGVGLDHSVPTRDNRAGMEQTEVVLAQQKQGLIVTNLVDFDMLYGHRRDAEGFAAALEEVDRWLPRLLAKLTEADLLLITADHGCDPTAPGTDHTREYVPLLVTSKKLRGSANLGVRESFADVGQTLAENFGLTLSSGCSFLKQLESCHE